MRKVVIYGTSCIIVLLILFTVISLKAQFDYKPTAPLQPSSGPGGSDYIHSSVKESVYGEGQNQYWIFEPDNPHPKSAPVIVFLHGWGATTPTFYRAWIDHLVRKGNIVIYPRYQVDFSTPSDNFTPNSIRAVKEALIELEKDGHVKAQQENFAIVGHSVGGLISVNMASLAISEGIPLPKVVFAVEPGKSRSSNDTVGPVLENLTKIHPNTLLLSLAGENDDWVGDEDARKIIRETTQIPLENKDFLLLSTDTHGQPPLWADHFAPLAPKIRLEGNNTQINISFWVDSRDYYGTWKLFDGLYEAGFYGKNREYALGNTTQQRFMGIWSDGTPVKEIKVTDTP
ncbi:MAG: alpha/beta hydrolase fold domain-containing protein [Methanobacteriaceae archaeon]|nr:alpha/beta hydrolase fold domain-containing protein [Methanobacteriaceae archaeon]